MTNATTNATQPTPNMASWTTATVTGHRLRALVDAAGETPLADLLYRAARLQETRADAIREAMLAAKTWPLACDHQCTANGCEQGRCYY